MEVGVLCSGSSLLIEHTRVSDTLPTAGMFGQGVHVQHDKPSDLGATLELTDVLVEKSYEFGIGAQNATITANRVNVNVCGCGSESRACKAKSAGLEPPPPPE